MKDADIHQAIPDNYTKQELTIDPAKAQTAAFLYFIPFLILFVVPYYILWKQNLSIAECKNVLSAYGKWGILVIPVVVLLGIIIHELIHGLTWSVFTKKGLRSISYGIIWKWLTPYCHCSEPLSVRHYIIGGIMPAIILGFLPCVFAILTGSLSLLVFGLFFTLAAGGDFMIINMLRNEPMQNLVQDHPSKIGCFIYRAEVS